MRNTQLDRLERDNADKIKRIYRDGDGIWVDLKPGWRAGESDMVHALHEMTTRDIIVAFREVFPCDCPDCQSAIQPPVSNRFSFGEREKIDGNVSGIDFGNNIQVLARSPGFALFWDGGHKYWSDRMNPSAYSASHLVFFYRSRQSQRLDWRRLGQEGGRLTVKRIADNADKITELFGEDFIAEITKAVKDGTTLLIEGGGEAFRKNGSVRYFFVDLGRRS